MVKASRWTELTTAMKFHVELAASSGTTAEFRFLNNSAPVIVSPNHVDVSLFKHYQSRFINTSFDILLIVCHIG